MGSFEQIGKVSLSVPETVLDQPENGVAFRFSHEDAPEFYDITLKGHELDRVVLNGISKGLNLGGCSPYDFEIPFPEAKDNLFVVCRNTRNGNLNNGDMSPDFIAGFKLAAKLSGYFHCGVLLAKRTQDKGWVSKGYAKTPAGISIPERYTVTQARLQDII